MTTIQSKLDQLSRDPDGTIRVTTDEFHEMMLDNITVPIHPTKMNTHGSKPRFLQGIPLGAGVYSVKLLPAEWEPEFGNIQLDPRTAWILRGTGLALKSPCCKPR